LAKDLEMEENEQKVEAFTFDHTIGGTIMPPRKCMGYSSNCAKHFTDRGKLSNSGC